MAMICKVDQLKNIDGFVGELCFELTKAEAADLCRLELAEGNLAFSGRAEHRNRVIHITGVIELILARPCDRCGEPVSIPLRCDFAEDFTNVPEKADEGAMSEEEEVHFFSGDEIDLLPYVEQAIYLALPMKTLCRPDCKGLCPQCGTNLNENECSCDQSPIDPRLAVLADLLNKG
ncbi:MAG: YceD family protein [Bacillota bacterium]|jgi:uncharacterized protein